MGSEPPRLLMYSPILSSPPSGDTTSVLSVIATAFSPLTPLPVASPPTTPPVLLLLPATAAAGREEVDAKVDECAAPWMAAPLPEAFGASGATKAAGVVAGVVRRTDVAPCGARKEQRFYGCTGTETETEMDMEMEMEWEWRHGRAGGFGEKSAVGCSTMQIFSGDAQRDRKWDGSAHT